MTNILQPNSRLRHRQLDLPTGSAEVWLEHAGSRIVFHTVRPNGSGTSYWNKCKYNGCLGEAVIQNTVCLRHADEAEIQNYLNSLKNNQNSLSLRGVEITQDLVNLLLRSSIVNENTIAIPVNLTGADISARLSFDNFTFLRDLIFTGAIIRESFQFNRCDFREHINAEFAFFNAGPPSFEQVIFAKPVHFSYAHTERVNIGFSNCSFEQDLLADGIVGALILDKCHLKSNLSITHAKASAILLTNCVVDAQLKLVDTQCGYLRAPNLRALAAHHIGPITLQHDLTFDHAQFGVRVLIEVQAQRLDLSGTQFFEGGQVLVNCSSVCLDQLSAGRTLRITGNNKTKKPAILSLQDADVGNMIFSNVDMSGCTFYGSRNLGSTVIEPTTTLAKAPGWWRVKRRCIADEFVWRANNGGKFSKNWVKAWQKISDQYSSLHGQGNPSQLPIIDASQIASVYRELRHSFEAKKNEPDASDFYYGEMEMRRCSPHASLTERMVITAYWLVSGYGLHAPRSLLAFLITIVAGTGVMFFYGFTHKTSLLDSVIFSLRSSLPGLRVAGNLTTTGEFTEIVLAILGPVLFALGVLAIRERIKRN